MRDLKKKIDYTGSRIFILLAFLLVNGCKQITKATDLITQPTAREIYAREFDKDSLPYINWHNAFKTAIEDSLQIELPYAESGVLNPSGYPVYAYNLDLNKGQVLQLNFNTDSIESKVFFDVYEQLADSVKTMVHKVSGDYQTQHLEYIIPKSGSYKILAQPQLYGNSSFNLSLFTTPVYDFPVSGRDGKSVQSFWGATRDGGRRSHEGIDIFADRGTPVVAAVDGFVSSTGNRGLGGKQVWLREGLFGNSLYYAHLDSIIVRQGQRVKTGDTLGLVGNTGNARTTPPHLHFGIYQGRNGAIDPYPYVHQSELPKVSTSEFSNFTVARVTTANANLRNSASAKSKKTGILKRNDTVQILGVSDSWLHIKTSGNQSAFIHQSLVEALE